VQVVDALLQVLEELLDGGPRAVVDDACVRTSLTASRRSWLNVAAPRGHSF
jgi:hypothetical protein